jgi:hypothetical protein
MVVLQELPDEEIQVSLPKDQEMVQALLLNRLYEPFDEGVYVGDWAI